MQEDIMKPDNVLPPDFTGVFYFTNTWLDQDFVGVWGKKQYVFPANATSPMVMPEHSPLEIQQIRKKFARDWAEQDFFRNSEHYKKLLAQERTIEGVAKLNSIQQAGTYTLDDLKEGIQKCLKPLEIKQAFVQTVQDTPIESKLSRNDDGELNTTAVDKKTSLRARALEGQGTPQQ
jgi:hypothetical protein